MILSGKFTEALVYAATLHKSQVRKATQVPYVSHLMAVAAIVLEYGGTEEEAIAALLHDAVEDQGGRPTLEAIRELFGAEVATIVEECTDADVQPKPEWRPRKQAYISHIAQASDSVRLVSAADKLHNATSILRDYYRFGEQLWGRFNGGKEGTLWYYRNLIEAFSGAGEHPLISELDRVVHQIEAAVNSAAVGDLSL